MNDLLASLRAARTEEEREWLVMKFSLESLDPAVREAVWAAAIPKWFDRDFLAALVSQPDDQEFAPVFEKLLSSSFVESFPGRGYNIHERSRALLLKHLWNGEQSRYRELNKRAADYCARHDTNDAQWCIAELYHLLLSGEDSGVNKFVNQGIEWKNQFEHGKVEALARPMIVEFEAKRLNPRAGAWAHYFHASSDLVYARYESVRRNLDVALSNDVGDLHLKAISLELLGTVCFMQDEHDEARNNFDEAVKSYRENHDKLGEANCIYWLGEIHRMSTEWEEARQKHEEALKLYQEVENDVGLANCFLSLGLILLQLGDSSQAQEKTDEALRLFKLTGNKFGEADAIKSQGDILLHLDKLEDAGQRYEEALVLFRQLKYRLGEANSISRLGHLYFRMGRYDEAKTRTDEAIELYREMGDKYGVETSLQTADKIKKALDKPTLTS